MANNWCVEGARGRVCEKEMVYLTTKGNSRKVPSERDFSMRTTGTHVFLPSTEKAALHLFSVKHRGRGANSVDDTVLLIRAGDTWFWFVKVLRIVRWGG